MVEPAEGETEDYVGL